MKNQGFYTFFLIQDGLSMDRSRHFIGEHVERLGRITKRGEIVIENKIINYRIEVITLW